MATFVCRLDGWCIMELLLLEKECYASHGKHLDKALLPDPAKICIVSVKLMLSRKSL